MEIHITGHHPLEVTDAMKATITKKLSKLSHFFNNIVDIHVTMSVDHLEHKVQAHVNLAKARISAHAVSRDMYTSIDEIFDKLKTQLTKHKEKLQQHGDEDQLL